MVGGRESKRKGESVVNLSFSFRTPSTSSYLLPGLMVRYGERRENMKQSVGKVNKKTIYRSPVFLLTLEADVWFIFSLHISFHQTTRTKDMWIERLMVYERQSVVNLSFSFRTPSTSSYLLVGVKEREDRRRQKTTNRGNKFSCNLGYAGLVVACLSPSCHYFLFPLSSLLSSWCLTAVNKAPAYYPAERH